MLKIHIRLRTTYFGCSGLWIVQSYTFVMNWVNYVIKNKGKVQLIILLLKFFSFVLWKKEKKEANLGPCIYRQEQVVRFLFELLVDVIIGNMRPLIVLIINLSITYRKFIILFLNSVDTIFIATITCVIVNNKNKVISLYKNNDLPTIAAYIIKLWKKKW